MSLSDAADPYQQALQAKLVTPMRRVRAFFRSRRKHVISFAGYGELGYQNPYRVEQIVHDVLSPFSRDDVLVNSGTLLRENGESGIAEIYAIARRLGIETTGIHPSVALGFHETHRPSPDCDYSFFIEDRTWGGFLDGNDAPSPTLLVISAVSDELVVIGGGKHAADELTWFSRLGKRIRYFPADMNHSIALDWARRVGAKITDYRGAARQAWLDHRQSQKMVESRP